MASEMCKVIGYDSFSELPGIHLGTCWTVRSAMLMTLYKDEKKRKKTSAVRWGQGSSALDRRCARAPSTIALAVVAAAADRAPQPAEPDA